MSKYIQIITITDSKEAADTIGNILLFEKLVSCVQILPSIESKYWWKGKIEKNMECLCLFKSEKRNYKKIEKIIKENHSYETPEIIALPILTGSKEYLKWISDTVI
jgi:periplasmic divalent cation tolerance protein